MIKFIKKNFIITIALLAYLLAFILKRDLFMAALKMTGLFIKEMAQVLPPVVLISALIAVWISRETIMRLLGKSSGFRGKLFALFIGSLSAGPIYAAFPVCKTLQKKGASLSNIVIILSSWAACKLPMLMVEAMFMGFKFAIIRYLLTLPVVFILGYLVGKAVKSEEVITVMEEPGEDIYLQLPGYNCKACGLSSCREFSREVAAGEKEMSLCVHLS